MESKCYLDLQIVTANASPLSRSRLPNSRGSKRLEIFRQQSLSSSWDQISQKFCSLSPLMRPAFAGQIRLWPCGQLVDISSISMGSLCSCLHQAGVSEKRAKGQYVFSRSDSRVKTFSMSLHHHLNFQNWQKQVSIGKVPRK
eukprot:Gb_15104 [translate_table: standard]